jgi:deoxyribose-phosphate aldolase
MLSRKKPVFLTTDALESWYFSSRIETQVRGYLRACSDYGIHVTTTEALLGGGAGLVPGPADTSACPGGGETCGACGRCVARAPERVQAIVASGATRVGAGPGVGVVDAAMAAMIDHTLLKADATEQDVRKLCAEAKQYGFASVCINPGWVKLARELLSGSRVMVCTVVGFPLGATTTTTKAIETRDAVANGADEIDMVINVGALKAKDFERVREDIAAVVEAAGGRTVKVILETALLTDDEKRKACELSVEAGAHFVKTSTGFGPSGATAADIALMRGVVGPNIGVKASGGIRDAAAARKMVEAGATRVGASASVAIVTGADAGKGKY